MRFTLCVVLLFLAGTLAGSAQDNPDRRKRDRESIPQRRSKTVPINPLRQLPLKDSTHPGAHLQRQEIAPGQPYRSEQVAEQREVRDLFDNVKEGLVSGNLGLFSQSFGSQVQLNLSGGESGTFSGNQAYYVIEKYLRSRKVVHLEFSTYGESSSNPYATGTMAMNTRGSRELAQVYVSVSRAGERWVITQINIY